MTIYKPIKDLAPRAADLAVALAKRKPVIANATINNGNIEVPSVFLTIIPVDKGNLQESVIKDDFKTYDEVYGNLPESQRPARR